MSKILFHAAQLVPGSESKNNNLFHQIIIWLYNLPHKFFAPNFTTIINCLKSDVIENNLAAISDLERIAVTQPKYHWVIIDILSKFVRVNAADISTKDLTVNSSTKNRQVIQAAISVISKRDSKQEPDDEQLDLSYTDLRGLNLQGVNFQHTNLYQSNLAGVNLAGANLEGAILTAANLEGANLNFANLSGAILSAANLDKANLGNANLQGANLYLASLQGAVLNDAILQGANLRETKLSMYSREQGTGNREQG
ncbi:MAG TPA: pentapeptide repeat-containing protein [Nostocaceae cyanobacterium]|nr:pentapeptide repeat-containing protein [Nostocaceae cyanobacterium]